MSPQRDRVPSSESDGSGITPHARRSAGALTEISLRATAPAPDALAAAQEALRSCGADPSGIVRSETGRTTKLSVYLPGGSPARAFARRLRTLRPAGWTLGAKALTEADWLTKWQRTYRIGPMGRTFAVVPLWLKSRYRGRRRPVYIDPKAAFGSGTHETTRIVVELLETLEGRFDRFLDAGTGTGVLLVAAARLGARRMTGIDEDAAALATARANLRHNRITGARLLRADVRLSAHRGRYDVVAANLISHTLVEARHRLAACVRKGGYLALSGIEKRHFGWFLAHFKAEGLVRVRSVRGRTWAGALYRRTR